MINAAQVQLIRDLTDDYEVSSWARSFTEAGIKIAEMNLLYTARAWGVLGPVRP